MKRLHWALGAVCAIAFLSMQPPVFGADEFGNGGILTVETGVAPTYAFNTVLQGDGKFLVDGEARLSFATRFDDNGQVDPTFGHNGTIWATDFGWRNWRRSLVAKDLSLYLGARIQAGILQVKHLSADGTQELWTSRAPAAFSGPSDVKACRENSSSVLSMSESHGGDLVVLGLCWRDVRNYGLFVQRFSPQGLLDVHFGADGTAWVVDSMPDLNQAALRELSSGALVVVRATPTPASTTQLEISRLSAEGLLDTSFGNGGTVIYQGAIGEQIADFIDLEIEPSGGVRFLYALREDNGMSLVAASLSETGTPQSSSRLGPTMSGFLALRGTVLASGDYLITGYCLSPMSLYRHVVGLLAMDAAGTLVAKNCFDPGVGEQAQLSGFAVTPLPDGRAIVAVTHSGAANTSYSLVRVDREGGVNFLDKSEADKRWAAAAALRR